MYKDLQYIKDGVEKIASWSHIIRIYEIDKSKGIYSQFNKLTDEHVVSSKIKKMEVKNCSQVFSHSLASAMYVIRILFEFEGHRNSRFTFIF
jgi:hypothetical protein